MPRDLRRMIAEQLRQHVDAFQASDVKIDSSQLVPGDVQQQLDFVKMPLVKKLHRAAGKGKLTGRSVRLKTSA